SLTTPVDVAADLPGLQYAFDFGSGYGAWGSSSGANFTTTDNGPLAVKGKVRDKDGGVTEYTATVQVNNVAPTAALSNGGPVSEGSPATVSFSGASDPSSADAAAGFRFSFALSPAGLAGSYAAAGAASSAQFTFADNGSYTVYGRVFDKDGGYTDYQTTVVVTNVAPTATLMGPAPGSVYAAGTA